MKSKQLLVAASIAGLLSVVLGAFGAHSLKPLLTEYQLTIYEKGVFYQFVHALAALFALISVKVFANDALRWAAFLFLLGIICFSGSLYFLALNDLIPIPKLILGPITPLGGLFFITGWAKLTWEFSKVSFLHQ